MRIFDSEQARLHHTCKDNKCLNTFLMFMWSLMKKFQVCKKYNWAGWFCKLLPPCKRWVDTTWMFWIYVWFFKKKWLLLIFRKNNMNGIYFSIFIFIFVQKVWLWDTRMSWIGWPEHVSSASFLYFVCLFWSFPNHSQSLQTILYPVHFLIFSILYSLIKSKGITKG